MTTDVDKTPLLLGLESLCYMQRMQQELARQRQQPPRHVQPPPPPRRQPPQHQQQQQAQLYNTNERLISPSSGHQQIQTMREALQAALVGRKRTWQQGLSSDTGGGDGAAGAAAAAAVPGGLHGRSALPAAAAAAAAAEARARACGPAEAGFVLSPPGNSAPGAGVSGSSAGAGASIGSGARKQIVTLSLSPVQAVPAAAGCSSSSQFQQQQQHPWQQQQQAVVEVAGSFYLLQEFGLLGSRAFDLDVAGTLLTVAEVPAYSELSGCCRLRRVRTPAVLANGAEASRNAVFLCTN